MSATFGDLMAEVGSASARFGHREHVLLTWLAVRAHGTGAAIPLVSDGIRQTARYAGAPQKYHATVSRAWVEIVGHHVEDDPGQTDFEAFLRRHPDLLDKTLLVRHYRSATLAGSAARTGWVAPDLQGFPWTRAGD